MPESPLRRLAHRLPLHARGLPPQEEAQEEPLEDRPGLGFVFVATYGRSGSTLLQGVLNSLPGYLVRGEHRDAVRHLFEFHRSCLTDQERVRHFKGVRTPQHAWYGMAGYPADRAVEELRRLVLTTLLRPGPETRVTGFKEIRWYADDVLDYVDFLLELFPGARFVVNTRSHDAVARSGWWREDEHALTTLARYEERLDALVAHVGEAAYRVHYDDYVADPTVLRGLVEWLGEAYDEEAVAAVFGLRHAPVTKPLPEHP